MSIARDALANAVVALVTMGDFSTISRRLEHWSQVDPSRQPALYVVMGNEVPHFVGKRGPVASWTRFGQLFVYAHSGDETQPGSVRLDPLLDKLESAFRPAAGEDAQTLGLAPTVSHARITKIETDDGALGSQAVAIVDFEVVCGS